MYRLTETMFGKMSNIITLYKRVIVPRDDVDLSFNTFSVYPTIENIPTPMVILKAIGSF